MANTKPSITLTLEQRKLILQLMNYSYTIPLEYHRSVAEAIKRYATKPLTDETIQNMVTKSQSVANSGFLLREDSMDLFRGKFAEWIACIEYNAMKNSSSVVMTILNPDETSKADLLHIVKFGNDFKVFAGPDIKTGGSTYVFNQWKKIVTSRHDIPMIDFDGVLTTEEGLKQLTKKQRLEYEELSKQFPHKKPVPAIFSNQDELRLRTDYFKQIIDMDGAFEYSPEVSRLLKAALTKKNIDLPKSDWEEFNKGCKELFKDFDASVNTPDGQCIEPPDVAKKNSPQDYRKHAESLRQKRASNSCTSETKVGEIIRTIVSSPNVKKALRIAKPILIEVGGTVALTLAVKAVEAVVTGRISTATSKTLPKAAAPSAVENAVQAITSNVIEKFDAKRASPILHTVRGHMRKGKYIEPYPRGGH